MLLQMKEYFGSPKLRKPEKAPIVFICENNNYSTFSPQYKNKVEKALQIKQKFLA